MNTSLRRGGEPEADDGLEGSPALTLADMRRALTALGRREVNLIEKIIVRRAADPDRAEPQQETCAALGITVREYERALEWWDDALLGVPKANDAGHMETPFEMLNRRLWERATRKIRNAERIASLRLREMAVPEIKQRLSLNDADYEWTSAWLAEAVRGQLPSQLDVVA